VAQEVVALGAQLMVRQEQQEPQTEAVVVAVVTDYHRGQEAMAALAVQA
jgi:hypothetical protein